MAEQSGLAPVRIWRVADYDDERRLAAIVDAAIDAAPAVAQRLAERARPPLVVVKPNWVQESHEHRPDVWEPVIAHPAVVLAVVAGLARRMAGRGTISLCDAPHTYAIWDAIVARGQLAERLGDVRRRWPHATIELVDLRREVWSRTEGVVTQRRRNPGDPRGYARLDLGRDSLFYDHVGQGQYYGADYDAGTVNEHHRGELQEYLVAATPVAADIFVNVPKLKTHKKTGLTCCLKNLVGINGDKNWLPHHTTAGPYCTGDEFPARRWPQRLEERVKTAGRKLMATVPGAGTWLYRRLRSAGQRMLGDSEAVVRNGNWHGNDTCWRMALDLNRALLYGNADGSWRQSPATKPFLAIVDGVIGGEGNGPLCPDAVRSSVVVSGDNPAAVDAVCARLMGFAPEELPIVACAFDEHRWPIAQGSLAEVGAIDERLGESLPLAAIEPAVPGGFRPHFGWQALRRAA